MSSAGRDYRIEGVHVQLALPEQDDGRPPAVLVHGGLHGSWTWHRFLPVLTDAGWSCHALDWYGHHLSDPLPVEEFTKRGIADVRQEIGLVAGRLGRPPVLIGHSMGALACLKYAEHNHAAALVLVAPVLPKAIGNVAADMAIVPDQPWGPPPFELARLLFFGGVAEDAARRYYDLLCPESPRCVAEATGKAAVPVDLDGIDVPVLVLVGDDDRLTPADRVQRLAEHLGAEFRRYPDRSHSLLLDGDAESTASLIASWLSAAQIN